MCESRTSRKHLVSCNHLAEPNEPLWLTARSIAGQISGISTSDCRGLGGALGVFRGRQKHLVNQARGCHPAAPADCHKERTLNGGFGCARCMSRKAVGRPTRCSDDPSAARNVSHGAKSPPKALTEGSRTKRNAHLRSRPEAIRRGRTLPTAPSSDASSKEKRASDRNQRSSS
jgi:hypothetical protein